MKALRRHHDERMKRHAVRTKSRIDIHDQDAERVEARKSYYRRISDHLKACSCHMCRNPRRSKLFKGDERLTMQERRYAE